MQNRVKIKRMRSLLVPVAGRLLVSESFASDRFFTRSVVLLLECGLDGVMGLVLNKVLDVSLEDVLLVDGVNDSELFVGGPVDEGRLFCLHNMSFISGCKSLGQDLFVGGSLVEVFAALQGKSNDYKARFYSGYSGWSYSQLELELKSESWVVVDRDFDIFDHRMDESLWSDLLLSLKDQYYTMWANMPKYPSRN